MKRSIFWTSAFVALMSVTAAVQDVVAVRSPSRAPISIDDIPMRPLASLESVEVDMQNLQQARVVVREKMMIAEARSQRSARRSRLCCWKKRKEYGVYYILIAGLTTTRVNG